MAGIIKILLVVILFNFSFAVAQTPGKDNLPAKDTAKTIISPVPKTTIGKIKDANYNAGHISLKEMYDMYFVFGKKDAYSSYNDFNYGNILTNYKFGNRFPNTDSLSYFNKNFTLILKLQKKELEKYDLGDFSKFLKISSEITAVIFAVKQFKK